MRITIFIRCGEWGINSFSNADIIIEFSEISYFQTIFKKIQKSKG